MEKIYEDYLDEKIPESLYQRKFDEFRAAQKKLQIISNKSKMITTAQ